MSTVLFVIVTRLIVMAIGALANRRATPKPKPLCRECAFAHIQHGACGRTAISCTFGGGVRVLKLDVLYCTDYTPRYTRPRPATGFVYEIAPTN